MENSADVLGPLAGLKVFELGIAIAAPNCGQKLASYGADVFKLESLGNLDVVRLLGSAWAKDDPELSQILSDTSPYVPEMNAGKYSVGIDLKSEKGLKIALRLLAHCDVFLSNVSAAAVVRLGLDYEAVKQINPNIIYTQLPGFGSDPELPYYRSLAWGPNQSPLVGLDSLTGFAEDPPAGVATTAPPDYMSSLHALVATLAGLEHRDTTGKGVHVDLSQFEATVSLLGPFLLDLEVNEHEQDRIGNASIWGAPQGVYPSCEPERWIAITADDADSWKILKELASPWLDSDLFHTERDRLENAQVLDQTLSDWTSSFSSDDLTVRLQVAGVAAHIVATNEDILNDGHVIDRGFYKMAPSTRLGRDLFSGSAIRLSDAPSRFRNAAPALGEDTREVLDKFIGMEREEFEELLAAGIIFEMTEPESTHKRPWDDWIHILIPGFEDARDLR
ncbi:MAG: hypothetical protein GWP30_08125 [Actinobacteria bacterium]|nr:hypothetical protein [Actinomycetota bacterium]